VPPVPSTYLRLIWRCNAAANFYCRWMLQQTALKDLLVKKSHQLQGKPKGKEKGGEAESVQVGASGVALGRGSC